MAAIVHMTSAHSRNDVRIFLKECRSLSQQGHDVTLLVADGLPGEVRDGVRILSVPKATGRLGRMTMGPARMLPRALGMKADLYHFHDPELMPLGLCLKLRGSRVIFDSHEDLPKQILDKPYLSKPIRRLVASMASLLQWAILPWFDGLVTATPTIRGVLERLNRNCVDINNYPIKGELMTMERSLPAHRNLAYIGGITRIRGVIELVAALEHLPTDIRLLMAGSFEDPALEQTMKAMPGWSHVDYLGIIGRDRVREVLADCMLGIVTYLPAPNHMEALPTKMFEYMSAGLAIIASDFPEWQRILEEGPCGRCADPQDPKALADAIATLLSQPDRVLEMGRHGQKLVADRYNWEVEAGKLGNLVSSICSKI